MKLQIALLRTNSDLQKQYDVEVRNMFNGLDEVTDIKHSGKATKQL